MSYADVDGLALWYGATGPAQLAILPGHTHYVMAGSPAVAEAATAFLDAVSS